jgi:glyoxylase-like metal-dependent hydrolase (beta-lactamase superfamily II)
VVSLTQRVVRVRAPNPSPMTLDGTNTYVVDVGAGKAAVIDPGPAHEGHLDAIEAAVRERNASVAGILVTHGHPDHAPGALPLQQRTGAPVYAHPTARFAHDVACADGDRIALGDVALHAIDAPGHARDHLVFYLPEERVLFTGDVIVGRGTVVIAPPSGDMRAYQATLVKLRERYAGARSIFGGHGERVDDVRAKLDEYIAHRIARERELLALLEERGPLTIPSAVTALYRNADRALWPAAARQLMAYLEALEREGRVRSHELARPATPEESVMLHPDLRRLGDAQTRRAIEAELGLRPGDTSVREYALVAS